MTLLTHRCVSYSERHPRLWPNDHRCVHCGNFGSSAEPDTDAQMQRDPQATAAPLRENLGPISGPKFT